MTITAQLELAASISGQLIDLVGAEGYIHGFVCVRPPCGPKPARVTAASLRIKTDGTVVHAKSGWAVGSVTKHPTVRGMYTAHRADGRVTNHEGKTEALKAVATAANKSHDSDTAPQAAPPHAPAAKAAAPVKAPAPARPPQSSTGGSERSGAAVWKTSEGTADLTPAEKTAIAHTWYSKVFSATQELLRDGDVNSGIRDYYGIHDDRDMARFAGDVKTFAAAIGKARPFESDVSLQRGVHLPAQIFGPPGSMNGKTVTDKGFVSATANLAVGDSYSHGFGNRRPGEDALVTIHARKGTRALKVDPAVWAASHPKKGQTPPEVLQEYTFAPGTSFRILSDTVDGSGVRRMDMEVVP